MRRNLSKKPALGVAAVFLALSLAACGGSGSSTAETQQTQESASVESSSEEKKESQRSAGSAAAENADSSGSSSADKKYAGTSQSSSTDKKTSGSSQSSAGSTDKKQTVSAQSDPGDGDSGASQSKKSTGSRISSEFVDTWYVFGDLDFESLNLDLYGNWVLRDRASSGASLIFEGYSVEDEDGALFLYDEDGADVGSAWIDDYDELSVLLVTSYEWLLPRYSDSDLLFSRSGNSIAYENPEEGGSDPGDTGYETGYAGYIGDWALFADSYNASISVYEDGTWLMRNARNSDGSGGYIIAEGSYDYSGGFGTMLLYEDGNDVGYLELGAEGGQLRLVLSTAYEGLISGYDELIFHLQ